MCPNLYTGALHLWVMGLTIYTKIIGTLSL